MRKVLEFLKHNIAFFVILAISLVFFLIAILGGDYQTTIFFGEVAHYQFVTGIADGVPLAFLLVVIPAACIALITILNFVKPKKRDGKLGLVFTAFFIGLATIAGAMLLLIPFALFKDAGVSFTTIYDWKALTADVFYVKTFNFPLLSMVLSLTFIIILGCYAAATMSE